VILPDSRASFFWRVDRSVQTDVRAKPGRPERRHRKRRLTVSRPSPVYLTIGLLTALPVRLLFRLRASGVENIPAGGCVLAANHTSNFDPWPLGLPLFPRRWLRFMAKSELFWPGLRWILKGGGAFPVRRGEADTDAIERAVELCRAGEIVVMFPEGTRRRKGLRKKHEARPHTGAARIALRAGVPLVPAAIVGTDRIGRLGPLRVRYGPPVPLDDLDGIPEREAANVATERLMGEIDRLEASLA
jgi:1-acyl-sn-glycerol-3-phosphate acyltransferase